MRWRLAALTAMMLDPAVPVAAESTDRPAARPTWQHRQWTPAANGTQLALWPEGLSITRPETTDPEIVGQGGSLVAGRAWTYAGQVSRPTMTIYRPRGRNTHAAMLVFPGGGYQVVAMDLEGTEVCDWVTARGMTCILLKYRVPQKWHPGTGAARVERQPTPFLPLQDAQRAIGLVRQRAVALGIDPHKVGVIGFSAGGHLVAAVSNATARSYAPVDAADAQPSRPDFAVALYPGHIRREDEGDGGVALAPWMKISRSAPPTMLVHAMDDPVDDVRQSIAYALALRRVHVPVELHLYAEGGHAFGLRPSGHPITGWPTLVERWLATIGVL